VIYDLGVVRTWHDTRY